MYCCLRLIYTRCDWLYWMEYRETQRMRKYGESKTTRIMMATLPHVTSGSGLRKFQTDGFLLDSVYNCTAFVRRWPVRSKWNIMRIIKIGCFARKRHLCLLNYCWCINMAHIRFTTLTVVDHPRPIFSSHTGQQLNPQ